MAQFWGPYTLAKNLPRLDLALHRERGRGRERGRAREREGEGERERGSERGRRDMRTHSDPPAPKPDARRAKACTDRPEINRSLQCMQTASASAAFRVPYLLSRARREEMVRMEREVVIGRRR